MFNEDKLQMIFFLIFLGLCLNIFQKLLFFFLLFLLFNLPLFLKNLHFLYIIKLFESWTSYLGEVESFYKLEVQVFSGVLVLEKHDCALVRGLLGFWVAVIGLGDHFHFVLQGFVVLRFLDKGEEFQKLEILGLSDGNIILIFFHYIFNYLNPKVDFLC